MERQTSRDFKKYYFDYNATSPYTRSFTKWLECGDLPFANPSSTHLLGQRSRSYINGAKKEISNTFSLSGSSFRVLFHSGASEGINTLVKGMSDYYRKRGEKFSFFYNQTDHSCIRNLCHYLKLNGDNTYAISTDKLGNINVDEIIEKINQCSGYVLYNFTWVNNETGVIWPLELAEKIKEKTNCFVHIDAVQSVAKIKDFTNLSLKLDAYTYSAHKFGGLKGTGFSIVSDNFKFTAFIDGGGQQEGMRSGTENPIGAHSITLSLKDINENYNYDEQLKAKNYIEDKLVQLIGNKGEIVARENENRNANTIYLIIYKVQADLIATAMDIENIAVSSGSACSSGSIIPSKTLLAMGYNSEEASSAIRMSFSPYLNIKDAKEYFKKINNVITRFIE